MSENITWKNLKLSKNTLNAVKALNFVKPTPIQAHVIPTFLKKKDIVAQAVTGSGKTLAFIIPTIELLEKMENVKSSDVISVILSPTTELANQTYEMFNNFLAHYNGSKPNLKVFNKKLISTEMESNKGVIIIATPGAFAKSIDKAVENAKFIKSLKATEILILDEADRLLEMGFEEQLLTIIKSLPKQRLTALFSATQTTENEDLIRAGLRNPVRVCVKVKQEGDIQLNDNLPKNMTNYHMIIENENKIDILIKFLSDKRDKKILVFLATCSCVDYYKNILSLILKKHNILAFHKKLKTKRLKVFDQFKNMKSGIMLCTDVMARGIDIPDIDWVVQLDPPQSATNFAHRCGRTARCDQFGQTLMFLRPSEDAYIHFLRENQNVQIQEYQPEFNIQEVDSFEIKMQDLCIKDRLLYEKSVNAFISYVMFYRKHLLKYIFKLSDIDMGKLANSFGLLRLPQMAELKGVDTSSFNSRDIDLKTLVYKDKSVRKVREKTRIIKQERREAEQNEEEEAPVAVKRSESQKKNKKSVNNKVDHSEEKKSGSKKKMNNTVKSNNVESMEIDEDHSEEKKSGSQKKRNNTVKNNVESMEIDEDHSEQKISLSKKKNKKNVDKKEIKSNENKEIPEKKKQVKRSFETEKLDDTKRIKLENAKVKEPVKEKVVGEKKAAYSGLLANLN